MHLLGSKQLVTSYSTDNSLAMFNSDLVKIVRKSEQPTCPSTDEQINIGNIQNETLLSF